MLFLRLPRRRAAGRYGLSYSGTCFPVGVGGENLYSREFFARTTGHVLVQPRPGRVYDGWILSRRLRLSLTV